MLVAHYARLLHEFGKDEQAENLCKELVAAHRERFGENHPLVGDALAAYSHYREACGDNARAEQLLREAVDVYKRDMRWPTRQFLAALVRLADMLRTKPEQRTQVQELLRLALQLCDQLDLRDPTEKALTFVRLARSLQEEKQPQAVQEAEKLLQGAYELGSASKSSLVQKSILVPTLSAQSAYYRQIGKLQESADRARKLRLVWPTDLDAAFASACHFAALIARVGKEKAIQEGYYKEAMESLKQALENLRGNSESLLQDTRLAPLKDWPEFQALLERLKPIK